MLVTKTWAASVVSDLFDIFDELQNAVAIGGDLLQANFKAAEADLCEIVVSKGLTSSIPGLLGLGRAETEAEVFAICEQKLFSLEAWIIKSALANASPLLESPRIGGEIAAGLGEVTVETVATVSCQHWVVRVSRLSAVRTTSRRTRKVSL
jgi:hypothetical protein